MNDVKKANEVVLKKVTLEDLALVKGSAGLSGSDVSTNASVRGGDGAVSENRQRVRSRVEPIEG